MFQEIRSIILTLNTDYFKNRTSCSPKTIRIGNWTCVLHIRIDFKAIVKTFFGGQMRHTGTQDCEITPILFLPKCITLHLSALNFICHSSVHLYNLSKSSFMLFTSSSVPAFPINFVSSAIFLIVILNSLIHLCIS